MILIASQQNETSTHQVMDWLEYLGSEFQKINAIDISNDLNIQISNEKIKSHFNKTDLNVSAQNAFWYRRWDFEVLIKKYQTKENGVQNNIELGCISNYIHFLFNKFPKINSIYDIDNKLIELFVAKEVGLLIPNSLVTNEKKHLLSFYNQNQRIITKPLSAHISKVINREIFLSYTTEVGQDTIDELEAHFFPSLFQENIEKEYEIRIFFIDDQFYPMAIFSQNDSQTQVDFRQYNIEKPNRTVPYTLPEEIQSKLKEFKNKMNINSGSIDMIKTKSGEYVFIELNPIGQFGMVSYPCNYKIEKIIAQKLIQYEKENTIPN
jgi:ATP-GRASP peptide maturase of grasp-with-spasm system